MSEKTRFAPVVLAGLATAALACVASAKAWFEASVDVGELPGVRGAETRADMPLALALSLVVLAAWGVVLVSRTRGRRIVAGLGILADLGVLASAILAPFTLPDQVREQLGTATGDLDVSPTGWYVAALVASALALPCLVAAWRLAPRWPAMGSRYDAPTASQSAVSETDLWKALDQGQDPTESGAS